MSYCPLWAGQSIVRGLGKRGWACSSPAALLPGSNAARQREGLYLVFVGLPS